MFGQGLIKGLQITWQEFFSKKFTVEYPDEQHTIPDRFHGRFELDVDKCIACGLCVNACPNNVIALKKERVGKKQYLTEYVMNIQYCLYCGLCVESCNKGALHFTEDFNMNQYFYRDIPLVLVNREAPAETEVAEQSPVKAEAKPKPKPKAKDKAEKPVKPAAESEVAAGKAPGKEGE